MEHHFNIDIAKDYGIEEAILLHNFFFWIAKNAANGENFHDGLFWTYNTRDSYAKLFEYMSESKIYRIIGNLVEKKLLVKGDYNTDRWKRPTWYAFTNDGLKYMAKNGYDIKPFNVHFQNDTHVCSKMNNREFQNEQSIIINNTDSNTNKDKEEDTKVSPKKNDYHAIIECWNECNGKRLGKVTKVTQRRKDAIKKALLDNDITQEQLMQFFKTLPFADSWLYNPNKQHKNWKPDFDWWLANTNGWLTKGLEGKVHLENPQAYSSIICGEDAPYTPVCEGSLSWNDYYKCYLYVGFWDGKFMPDGYTDENRPDGASVMLNNGRGVISWDAETKKWRKTNE